MKTLRWNLGIAIIRIGYIVRDRWGWWRIGVLILLIGYKLRGESTPSVDQIIDDINGLVIYQGDEDTPSTESQEALFDELFSIYFARLHEGLSMYDAVKEMETRYTLTRKP